MNLKSLKQFLAEERAVSPVIGVILMVAITVILAAVIGTFVLGLGDRVDQSPQAAFTFSYDATNNNVTITHDGGDALDTSTIEVRVGSDVAYSPSGTVTAGYTTPIAWSSSVTAGDELVINNAGYTSGEEVRIVWSSPSGDKTATLGQWTIP